MLLLLWKVNWLQRIYLWLVVYYLTTNKVKWITMTCVIFTTMPWPISAMFLGVVNYNKIDFFFRVKTLEKSIKSPQKILFWGFNWLLMTFETNSLETEISTAFVTFETEISTAYITLETNVLSLLRISNLWKI